MAVGRLYSYVAGIFLVSLLCVTHIKLEWPEKGWKPHSSMGNVWMQGKGKEKKAGARPTIGMDRSFKERSAVVRGAEATVSHRTTVQPDCSAEQPSPPPSPRKLELGSLHKRRASASPQKFNTGKFEPLPLRLDTSNTKTDDRPKKRARIENKLEITYDSAGTPRIASITPTFSLSSGRKISGSRLLNPGHLSATKQPFSIINAFLRDNDLLMLLVSCLTIPSLIDLYAISRPFHYLVNGAFTAFILANVRTWAPDADKIFPWRCYQSLCIKDPRLRQKSSWKGQDVKVKHHDLRDLPSLRWLQMVVWRQGVCKDMLVQLATQGLRCPAGTLDAIKRMWFLMDLPLNAQRVAVVRSEDYITNATIFRATLFFLKVDMAFTDPLGALYPVNGPHMDPRVHLPQWQNTGLVGCSLRALLTAERNFTPLWRALRGVCPDPNEPMLPITRLDVLRLWIRHKYHLPDTVGEHVKRQSILGIPWHEVGTAGLERTGVSHYHSADGTSITIHHPALTTHVTQHTHVEQQFLYPHQKRLLVPTQKVRERLLRPEELVLREGVKRRMRLHTQWSRMMLWGFCDDLGRNLALRSEDELLRWSHGKRPLSYWKTDAEVMEARKKREVAEAEKGGGTEATAVSGGAAAAELVAGKAASA